MDAQFALSVGIIKLAEISSSFISSEINLKKNAEKDLKLIMDLSQSMQAFLSVYDEVTGDPILQSRCQLIQTLAYDIDDAIDEFWFRVPGNIRGRKPTKPGRDAIRTMCSQIKRIRERIENMKLQDIMGISISNNTNTAEDLNPAMEFTLEDDFVGFECETEEITSWLLSREPPRSLISLVGPAGSGKTALANHVYGSKRVRSHFSRRRAWVSVSHPLNRQKVLQSILTQLCDGKGKSNLSDENPILEALKRSLRKSSYLVVLDGLRSKIECNFIMDALSKVSQLNRIIVTSQISDIASSCLHKYELKGLPLEKALTLFCKRAFRTSNGRCPPNLAVCTEQIVKKCEGLPMILVEAGNLLSNTVQTPGEWSNVHDELGAKLPIFRRRLLPSYKDLIIHLRFCLLYFGVFPEGHCIGRERLIRLWIAEEVIEGNGGSGLEDVAEDYLNELIGRNLVYVTARDIDGRVKSCRLQHLVHQFIVCKAEEQNFVKILSNRRNQSSWDKARRLSIRTNNTKSLEEKMLNQIRSAFLFAKADCSFLHAFKLLKVLEMRGAPINSFPDYITKLTLLSYLSLRQTKVSSIPRSIKRLQRLETLDLRQTLVSCLPKAIRKLHRLCHLLVYRCEDKDSGRFDSVRGVEISSYLGVSNWPRVTESDGRRRSAVDRHLKGFESSIGLTGTLDWPAIQKLSLLKADGMILENLSNFTNLRKLGLVVLRREDGRKICESIQKMEHLSILEIMTENEEDYLDLDHIPGQPGFINLRCLCLKGGLRELPRWVCQLPSLVKISLMWSRLNSSPLLPLQTLPNLMQLELVDAYRGNSLEFKADLFPKLKVLHFQQFNELRTLVLRENAISKPVKLTISRCPNLTVQSYGDKGILEYR